MIHSFKKSAAEGMSLAQHWPPGHRWVITDPVYLVWGKKQKPPGLVHNPSPVYLSRVPASPSNFTQQNPRLSMKLPPLLPIHCVSLTALASLRLLMASPQMPSSQNPERYPFLALLPSPWQLPGSEDVSSTLGLVFS